MTKPKKPDLEALRKRSRFDGWLRDSVRRLMRDDAEDAIRDEPGEPLELTFPPHMLRRYRAPSAEETQRLLEADERATAAWSHLSAQAARLAAARQAALDGLPSSLREMLNHTLAELERAEEELSTMQRRLAGLTDEPSEMWAQRRAQLQGNVNSLEALVAERRGDYQRMCKQARYALDSVLRGYEMEADAQLTVAKQHYDQVKKRLKAELVRLDQERRAFAAVRSEILDPIAVEKQLGRQVTPSPRKESPAERMARHEREITAIQLGVKGVK